MWKENVDSFVVLEDIFTDTVPWSARKANKWVVHLFSLVAKMTQLRLLYFGHIVRHLIGNNTNVTESGRQKEKRKTKHKIGWLNKEIHDL